MTNIFKVSSGLGRYQFSKPSANATPVTAAKTPETPQMRTCYKSNEQQRNDGFRKSDQEIIKQNNNELIMLRESYLKLKSQYENERNNYVKKLNDLEQRLRNEKERYSNLYNEYEKLTKSKGTKEFYQTNGRSIAVVDDIWRLMKNYRQAVCTSSGIKTENSFDYELKQNE